MKYSHRFFLYAPVAAVIVLATAVSIYWYVVSSAFSKRLEALNGHQIAPGVTFQYDYKTIGGFPFRVDAVLENLRVTVATPHGPARWQTQKFALHMLDYGEVHVVFEAAGRQVVSWHDGAGRERGVDFTPALLRASALGRGGRIGRVDVELYGAATAPLSVQHTELHMRRDPGSDALDVVAMADGVKLAPTLANALGDTISKLRLKATLAPADDWNALLSGKASWPKAAAAWQKDDGALAVKELRLDWGKTSVAGDGALTLDSAHRLMGLLHLKVAGYQALAEEAGREHLVTGTQESLLKGLMQQAAEAGKSEGRLPVTLAFKDGLAYVNSTPAGFLDPLY